MDFSLNPPGGGLQQVQTGSSRRPSTPADPPEDLACFHPALYILFPPAFNLSTGRPTSQVRATGLYYSSREVWEGAHRWKVRMKYTLHDMYGTMTLDWIEAVDAASSRYVKATAQIPPRK